MSTSKETGVCVRCENVKAKAYKKFCSRQCMLDFRREAKDAAARASTDLKSIFKTPRTIRSYILRTREHACSICKTRMWNGIPVALVVDHVNGNAADNREENLRLLCNNCDAQLPTYKNKNRGFGRFARRARYKAGKSY